MALDEPHKAMAVLVCMDKTNSRNIDIDAVMKTDQYATELKKAKTKDKAYAYGFVKSHSVISLKEMNQVQARMDRAYASSEQFSPKPPKLPDDELISVRRIAQRNRVNGFGSDEENHDEHKRPDQTSNTPVDANETERELLNREQDESVGIGNGNPVTEENTFNVFDDIGKADEGAEHQENEEEGDILGDWMKTNDDPPNNVNDDLLDSEDTEIDHFGDGRRHAYDRDDNIDEDDIEEKDSTVDDHSHRGIDDMIRDSLGALGGSGGIGGFEDALDDKMGEIEEGGEQILEDVADGIQYTIENGGENIDVDDVENVGLDFLEAPIGHDTVEDIKNGEWGDAFFDFFNPERIVDDTENAVEDFFGLDDEQTNNQTASNLKQSKAVAHAIAEFERRTFGKVVSEKDRSSVAQQIDDTLVHNSDHLTRDEDAEGSLAEKKGKLRTHFKLAPEQSVIPRTIEQIRSDITFDLFGEVRPGHGLGATNKLFVYDNIRDEKIIGRSPMFTPRPWDGPIQSVDTPDVRFQANIPPRMVSLEMQRKELMKKMKLNLLRKMGASSTNVLGDDRGLASGVSEKLLKRPADSVLEPVCMNTGTWFRTKLETGQDFSKRKMRRLFDPMRQEESSLGTQNTLGLGGRASLMYQTLVNM